MNQRASKIAASFLILSMIAAMIACGRDPESTAPRSGLVEEYVDPAGEGGAHLLLLYEGGDFQLRHCPLELCDLDSPSELVAGGEWQQSEGVLVLTTEDWEAMFVSAIVPVELLGRSDTLRGFQWMQSSSQTPVDTCRFIRRSDFVNFVNPPEGSGTSGF